MVGRKNPHNTSDSLPFVNILFGSHLVQRSTNMTFPESRWGAVEVVTLLGSLIQFLVSSRIIYTFSNVTSSTVDEKDRQDAKLFTISVYIKYGI